MEAMQMLQPDRRAAKPRRSTMELMCDILETVSSGDAKPTQILLKANLSWKVMNECMSTLLNDKLLSKTSDGKRDTYSLTERGYSVLGLYRELRAALLKDRGIYTPQFLGQSF